RDAPLRSGGVTAGPCLGSRLPKIQRPFKGARQCLDALEEKAGPSTGRFPSDCDDDLRARSTFSPSRKQVGYFACALAGDFTAEADAPSLRGIFPARHSFINL